MKMKLFRYGYLIRHTFDLGRIFPLLIKQRGISQLIAGIGSQITSAPTTIWTFIHNLDQYILRFSSGLIPGRVSELSSINPFSLRIDNVIQIEIRIIVTARQYIAIVRHTVAVGVAGRPLTNYEIIPRNGVGLAQR